MPSFRLYFFFYELESLRDLVLNSIALVEFGRCFLHPRRPRLIFSRDSGCDLGQRMLGFNRFHPSNYTLEHDPRWYPKGPQEQFEVFLPNRSIDFTLLFSCHQIPSRSSNKLGNFRLTRLRRFLGLRPFHHRFSYNLHIFTQRLTAKSRVTRISGQAHHCGGAVIALSSRRSRLFTGARATD